MKFTRNEAALSAWALAIGAGENMRNSALEAGISDSTNGRLFAESRMIRENKGCYSLGYHLGRFTLLQRIRLLNTIGEAKRTLWEEFKTSPEGRGHAASYRMLDA